MEHQRILATLGGGLFTAGCAALLAGVLNGNPVIGSVGAGGIVLGAGGLLSLYFMARRAKPISPINPAIRIGKAGTVSLARNGYRGSLFASDETANLHAVDNEDLGQ